MKKLNSKLVDNSNGKKKKTDHEICQHIKKITPELYQEYKDRSNIHKSVSAIYQDNKG